MGLPKTVAGPSGGTKHSPSSAVGKNSDMTNNLDGDDDDDDVVGRYGRRTCPCTSNRGWNAEQVKAAADHKSAFARTNMMYVQSSSLRLDQETDRRGYDVVGIDKVKLYSMQTLPSKDFTQQAWIIDDAIAETKELNPNQSIDSFDSFFPLLFMAFQSWLRHDCLRVGCCYFCTIKISYRSLKIPEQLLQGQFRQIFPSALQNAATPTN
jgi:hypothetical protein